MPGKLRYLTLFYSSLLDMRTANNRNVQSKDQKPVETRNFKKSHAHTNDVVIPPNPNSTGGERVTFRGLKLTKSLGKHQHELSTRT